MSPAELAVRFWKLRSSVRLLREPDERKALMGGTRTGVDGLGGFVAALAGGLKETGGGRRVVRLSSGGLVCETGPDRTESRGRCCVESRLAGSDSALRLDSRVRGSGASRVAEGTSASAPARGARVDVLDWATPERASSYSPRGAWADDDGSWLRGEAGGGESSSGAASAA